MADKVMNRFTSRTTGRGSGAAYCLHFRRMLLPAHHPSRNPYPILPARRRTLQRLHDSCTKLCGKGAKPWGLWNPRNDESVYLPGYLRLDENQAQKFAGIDCDVEIGPGRLDHGRTRIPSYRRKVPPKRQQDATAQFRSDHPPAQLRLKDAFPRPSPPSRLLGWPVGIIALRAGPPSTTPYGETTATGCLLGASQRDDGYFRQGQFFCLPSPHLDTTRIASYCTLGHRWDEPNKKIDCGISPSSWLAHPYDSSLSIHFSTCTGRYDASSPRTSSTVPPAIIRARFSARRNPSDTAWSKNLSSGS